MGFNRKLLFEGEKEAEFLNFDSSSDLAIWDRTVFATSSADGSLLQD